MKRQRAHPSPPDRATTKLLAHSDLRQRPQRLDLCMQRMRMTTIPKAVLWARIKALDPKSAVAP